MTWTTPHTYGVAEIFSASTANLDIRDNLTFLKNTLTATATSGRALDTAYQNGGNIRCVVATLRLTSSSTGAQLDGYVGVNSTPSTAQLQGSLANSYSGTSPGASTVWKNMVMWVPPDYWYKVVTVAAGGTVASVLWAEYEIYG